MMARKLILISIIILSTFPACLNFKYPWPFIDGYGHLFFTCWDQKDCYDTEVCFQPLCFTKCETENDCLKDDRLTPCREKNGHKICHYCEEGECFPNEICHEEVCRQKCSNSNECKKNYRCDKGLCLPNAAFDKENENNLPDGG